MKSLQKWWIHLFLTAALLLLIVGAIGTTQSAVALSEIVVLRDLPDDIQPGDTFDVTITFSAPADNFMSLGIHDEVPEDWQVAVDKDACLPPAFTEKAVSTNEIEYTWLGPYEAGQTFRAIYEVTVPAGIAGGQYALPGGYLVYYVVRDKYNADITGNSEILVKSDAPEEPPAAVEDPVISNTPDKLGPENDSTDTVDITEVADFVEDEIAETRVRNSTSDSAQSGSQAIPPEPTTSQPPLLFPPRPEDSSEPVCWPALWGVIGGVVIIIGLFIIFKLRRRPY